MPKNTQNNQDDNGIIVILLVIFILIALVLIYNKYRLIIHTIIGWSIQGQLYPFAPFFSVPERMLNWIDRVNLGEQSMQNLLTLLGIAGRYFRWISIPICGFLAGRIFYGSVVERYRFRMTARQLICHNAQFLPCLRPIAGRDLMAEDIDSGPWRAARQALQFAVEHGFLFIRNAQKELVPVDADRTPGTHGIVLGKNGIPRENSPCLIKPDGSFSAEHALTFNTEAALKIFERQLEQRYIDRFSLPNHMTGLAAAFMAFGFGDKDTAQILLDHMSTSFQGNQEQGWTVTTGDADQIFDKYLEYDEIKEILSLHGAFAIPFLMALLMFAKQKGVLASSQYIWLKPLDRTLWYALNQMGGKAAWAEAAGPWAHFQFEDLLGETVEEPQCDEAVKALRYVLEMEGWLPAEVSRANKGNERKMPAKEQDPRTRFQKGHA